MVVVAKVAVVRCFLQNTCRCNSALPPGAQGRTQLTSEFAQRCCWSSLNFGSRARRGGDRIWRYAAILNLFA